MNTPVGFCSEHSVEYLLVPRLVASCRGKGNDAIALFYWLRREGSAAARWSMPDRRVHVAAIFACRPKPVGPHTVEIKFNEELFEYASVGQDLGIPTLAGAPLATTIFDLRPECPVAWFALEAQPPLPRFARVEVRPPHRPIAMDSGVGGPLVDDEAVDFVLNNSTPRRWSDVAEAIREIRNRSYLRRYVGWGAGYKPFILVLWDPETLS